MGDATLIPDCSCGAGKMTINCASSKASNPLRYYYKCPSEKNHRRSFIWCDEYHANQRTEQMPKFLASQTWTPTSGATSSQTECNSPFVDRKEENVGPKLNPLDRAPSEQVPTINNQFSASPSVFFWVFTCAASVFMCFVLVLLGVILGKLM